MTAAQYRLMRRLESLIEQLPESHPVVPTLRALRNRVESRAVEEEDRNWVVSALANHLNKKEVNYGRKVPPHQCLEDAEERIHKPQRRQRHPGDYQGPRWA